jgi:hypothetical protein
MLIVEDETRWRTRSATAYASRRSRQTSPVTATAPAPTIGPPVRRSTVCGWTLRREVHRDGRYVALSRKQFAVLEVLVSAEGGSSAPRNS